MRILACLALLTWSIASTRAEAPTNSAPVGEYVVISRVTYDKLMKQLQDAAELMEASESSLEKCSIVIDRLSKSLENEHKKGLCA